MDKLNSLLASATLKHGAIDDKQNVVSTLTAAEALAAFACAKKEKKIEVAKFLKLFKNGKEFKEWVALISPYVRDTMDFARIDLIKVTAGMSADQKALKDAVDTAKVTHFAVTPFNASAMLGKLSFTKFNKWDGDSMVYQNVRTGESFNIDVSGFEGYYKSVISAITTLSTAAKEEYHIVPYDKYSMHAAMAIATYYDPKVEGVTVTFLPKSKQELPPYQTSTFGKFGTYFFKELDSLVGKLNGGILGGGVPEQDNAVAFIYYCLWLFKIDFGSMKEFFDASDNVIALETGALEAKKDEMMKEFLKDYIAGKSPLDVPFKTAKQCLNDSRTWREGSKKTNNQTHDLMVDGFFPHFSDNKWGVLTRLFCIEKAASMARSKDKNWLFFDKVVLVGAGSDLTASCLLYILKNDPTYEGLKKKVEIKIYQHGEPKMIDGVTYAPPLETDKFYTIAELFTRVSKAAKGEVTGYENNTLVLFNDYNPKMFPFDTSKKEDFEDTALCYVMDNIPVDARGILLCQHHLCEADKFMAVYKSCGYHTVDIYKHPRKHNDDFYWMCQLNQRSKQSPGFELIEKRTDFCFEVLLKNIQRNGWTAFGFDFDMKKGQRLDPALRQAYGSIIFNRDRFKDVKKQSAGVVKGKAFLKDKEFEAERAEYEKKLEAKFGEKTQNVVPTRFEVMQVVPPVVNPIIPSDVANKFMTDLIEGFVSQETQITQATLGTMETFIPSEASKDGNEEVDEEEEQEEKESKEEEVSSSESSDKDLKPRKSRKTTPAKKTTPPARGGKRRK